MTSPQSPPYFNTICLHGPQKPTVEGHTDFVSIDTSGASILLHTVEEADAFIRAAVEAKGLLLANAPRASCGHLADEDGECGCSSWPERAPLPPAECSACGATTELAAVHDTGGDGSVLYYCGDLEACQARRIARDVVRAAQ